MIVIIEKLDHFGRGISHIDGKVMFIPNTVIGDKVEVKIIKEHKKFLEGKVIQYIEKMPRYSKCPYSEVCGGCHLINLETSSQIEMKRKKVEELFEKTLKRKILVQEIITGKTSFYRNKINLHVKNGKLGFYQEGTNNIVEIESCYITKKEINSLIPPLKQFVEKHDIEEVMIKSHKGLLLSIRGNVSKEDVLECFDCDTIYLNDRLIKGNAKVEEELLGKTFMISPRSFFQVNKEVSSKVFLKVREYIKGKKYNRALDLYCGTGVIGILIADLVKEVTGIEVVDAAVRDAEDNKQKNHISNINFICDRVENRIDEFQNIDLVVVDPPRSGLDKKSRETLLKMRPSDIIYISCNPSTLVRDIKELETLYDIKDLVIADMFPNTYHVESVILLSRKSHQN